MKKILSAILTIAMITTLFAAFGMVSNAAPAERVIPRFDKPIVVDGDGSDALWANAYTEELNINNAVCTVSDFPLDENKFNTNTQVEYSDDKVATLTAKIGYYTEFAEDTDPSDMYIDEDPNGGMYFLFNVKDNTKCFTASFDGDASAYAAAQDTVQIFLDAGNFEANAKDSNNLFLSLCPYSIFRYGGPGVGICAGGPGYWFEHSKWNNGSSLDTIAKNIEYATKVDYVFDPAHTLEDAGSNKRKQAEAYMFADVTGYTIECKLKWTAFTYDTDGGSEFAKPVEGNSFGMGIGLIDYCWLAGIGVEHNPVDRAQAIYQGMANWGTEYDDWGTVTSTPSLLNKYTFGGFAGSEKPSLDFAEFDSALAAAEAKVKPYPTTEYTHNNNLVEVIEQAKALKADPAATQDKVNELAASLKSLTEAFVATPKGGDTVKGDIDGNGEVTLNDAMLIINHVAKKASLEGDELAKADIDANGEVTLNDAMYIINYVAKKSDTVGPKA